MKINTINKSVMLISTCAGARACAGSAKNTSHRAIINTAAEKCDARQQIDLINSTPQLSSQTCCEQPIDKDVSCLSTSKARQTTQIPVESNTAMPGELQTKDPAQGRSRVCLNHPFTTIACHRIAPYDVKRPSTSPASAAHQSLQPPPSPHSTQRASPGLAC